jgi:hypothetical protein
MQCVELYSPAQFSFELDKYPALAAMAKLFDLGEYVAGVWAVDLPRGLLWIIRSVPDTSLLRDTRLPSWSWASLNDPISYSLLPGIRDEILPDDDCF